MNYGEQGSTVRHGKGSPSVHNVIDDPKYAEIVRTARLQLTID